MLRIFQNFHPLSFAGLCLYAFLLHWIYFLHPLAFTSVDLHYSGDLLFNRWLGTGQWPYVLTESLHILFIVLQGILLSLLLSRFRILQEPSLVPALLYVATDSLFPEFQTLFPELLIPFLSLWALFRIFSLYNRTTADNRIFDTGLLSGLQCLLFFPAVAFGLYNFFTLIRMRSTSFREIVLFFCGPLCVFFLCGIAFFWTGSLGDFLQDWGRIPAAAPDFHPLIFAYNAAKFILLGVLLIITLLFISLTFSTNLIRIRKYIGSMIWFLVFAFLSLLPAGEIHFTNTFVLVLPFAMLFGYQLAQTRNRIFAEILHGVLLLATVLFQYLTFVR